MIRRDFIALVGGAAVGWPLVARGQQPATPVIGVLNSGGSLSQEALAALRRGLGEMGYVEGRNVAIEMLSTEHYDQMPALAAELVARGRPASTSVAL